MSSVDIRGTSAEVFVHRILEVRQLHCDEKWKGIRAESLEPFDNFDDVDVDVHEYRRSWLGYKNAKEEQEGREKIRSMHRTRTIEEEKEFSLKGYRGFHKGQGSHCNAGQIVTFNVVSSTLSPSPSSTPSRLRPSSPSESPSSQPSGVSENTLSPSTNSGICNNDPLYKFEIKPGKFRKCKFISKNLAKLSTRRAKYCYENDDFTVSSTGVACILACGLCDPSSYPSVSPSLSLVPTTECSIPGQKLFQVEVNLDGSIKENVIVVKKQVCVLSQCRFSKKVFRRNKKKFDTPNGTYNWRKCLNPNNCYRFQIFDSGANNVGDGFTNNGDYTVTWDGNTVKSFNFNTPGNLKKEIVKFGKCASSSQQISTRKEHTTKNIFE